MEIFCSIFFGGLFFGTTLELQESWVKTLVFSLTFFSILALYMIGLKKLIKMLIFSSARSLKELELQKEKWDTMERRPQRSLRVGASFGLLDGVGIHVEHDDREIQQFFSGCGELPSARPNPP